MLYKKKLKFEKKLNRCEFPAVARDLHGWKATFGKNNNPLCEDRFTETKILSTATMFARAVIVLALVAVAYSKHLIFNNRLGETIWVGSLGNDQKPPIQNGGWAMGPNSERSFDVDDSWAGRFWARTGCRFDGNGFGPCETGDCGNKLECGGNGGRPPVSLAEFTFSGWGGQDFYDVSLVDGSNVPTSIIPLDNIGGGDHYRCTEAACHADLNQNCPNELRLVENGRTVGCKSACLAFNTDLYCCRGEHNIPETCRNWMFPVDYPGWFKSQCPDAYSFAYDDVASTFTCDNTGYRITFG